MKLYRLFRFRQHRHKNSCPYANYETLDQVRDDESVLVVCNPHRRTLEMGISPNSIVSIIRNRDSEPNLIVGIDNGRLIVAKKVAERIRVQPITSKIEPAAEV
jgi:Fe2+ transport system protein FeoA